MCSGGYTCTPSTGGDHKRAYAIQEIVGLPFPRPVDRFAGVRVFNTLAGLTPADDDLPERLKTEPIPAGPAKGRLISQAALDLMLDEYCEARGWTPEGVPTRAKLKELRLGHAADKLAQP